MSKLNYLPDDNLKAAVKMAIKMEIPLFLTGDPGTGKTELAYWVAQNAEYQQAFGLKADVLRFNVKTTSTAKDLLYRYDAIRHFRDNQRQNAAANADNVMNYIHFEALGQAIMAARGGRRHVVLVDEIDKAPRDFPNDLLFEFEKLGFRIDEATKNDLDDPAFRWDEMPSLAGLDIKGRPAMDEQGFIFYADKAEREKHRNERLVSKPVLIITSNSEKNLPDAFLRRCAFYHIPFPEDKARLLQILAEKGLYDADTKQEMVSTAVDFFLKIRKSGLRRNPATAELIAWVDFLWANGVNPNADLTSADLTKLEPSLSMLGKNKEDLQRIRERLKSKNPLTNI